MAPPVGDLRWAAPQPKAPWSPAVLDASQYSAGCPQQCQLPTCKFYRLAMHIRVEVQMFSRLTEFIHSKKSVMNSKQITFIVIKVVF
jgi:hypothetical protein